jgi:UPF0176 protein
MFEIFGFYKFTKIKSLKKNKVLLENFLKKKNIRGTIIIANEGVNATISGKNADIKSAIVKIRKILNLKKFDSENVSMSKYQPFHKPKIKIKDEVVPMGFSLTSKNKKVNYIDPKKWNKLINDKETMVLDLRKPFEYKVGSFKRSVNPNVDNFRQFPKYLNKLKKNKPIAMFCTGGIRCEKASVYLEKNGFQNIYQLKGGILNYLKIIKKRESSWKGECFVFDNRISLKHGLVPGSYAICSGCRMPISQKDKSSEKYEEGVSCPSCHYKLTKTQKSRFRMRQSQIYKAKQSKKKHIFQKEFK